MQGIDVSIYQGHNIDWRKVRADGIEFAMLKATQGRSSVQGENHFIDPTFERNYAEAKTAGLKVGAYHFLMATTAEEAREEARYYLSVLNGKQFDFPVAVDVEDSAKYNYYPSKFAPSLIADMVTAFCTTLEMAGYWAMLYTNSNYIKNILGKEYDRLRGYALWRANWYSLNAVTAIPAQTHTSVGEGIWQYGLRYVNGVSGAVDCNTAYIDYSVPIRERCLNGYAPEPKPAPEIPDVPQLAVPVEETVDYWRNKTLKLQADVRALLQVHNF